MKWLLAGLIGSLSGWLIANVTDQVAIASSSGGAIGVLATIALFGTRPALSVFKVAGAMGLGCLAGWLVAAVTGGLTGAMMIGAAVGTLATISLTSERPLISLLKLAGAMGFGFVVGWGIGTLIGDHRLGMALAIPLGLPVLVLMADSIRPTRRRPF